MVLRLADLGLPMEKIFQQVMTPALYELGRRWQSGELLVGQEKEISALSRDLIAHLSLSASSEPSHEASIVAACVTGEHHELGLRMIVGVLQSHGYLVHYLGPDVSPPFLLEAVRLRRPDLVLLSATLASHLDSVRETARVLVAELPAESMPTLVIGGQIVAVHHDALIGLGLHASENGDIETTIQRVLALIEPEAD